MEQANNKKIFIYKTLLYTLGIALGLALLLPKCSGGNKIQPIDTKRYDLIIDSLKKSKVKIVYLDSVREKVVVKYKTVRNTVNIHDTTQVIEFINTCDTVIAVDSLEINELKLSNKLYEEQLYYKIQVVKDLRHQLDSTAKSKRKYFKGFKHGFIAGTAITGGVLGTFIIK